MHIETKITMVLHKGINFMRFYFVFVFLFTLGNCSHAESKASNSSIKSLVVQEIMKKVSNITLGALSKAPPEKKETILHKIENKLKKSAKAMGPDADKYVKFIMEEFKTKAFSAKQPKNDSNDIRKSNYKINVENVIKPRSVISPDTKQEIIKDIANKIQVLAKEFMKNAKTIESKKEILEKIKKKIMDSTQQKHMQLHSKHEELKAYSNLIAQGLEVSMRKMLAAETDARRMDSPSIIKPVSEELTIEDRKPENLSNLEDDLLKKTMVVMDIEEINKYKNLISQFLNATAIDPRCDEIVEDTCLGIQSFNKIPCDGANMIPIENLCNGVVDCLTEVDEMNCTAQAMEKVRKATKIMSDINESFNSKCFPSTDAHLLKSQNKILRDVLQAQMNFLEKHVKTPLQTTQHKDQVLDEILIKRTVTDVNMVLSTLSYALDGALCAHTVNPDNQGNTAFRKYNDIEVDELEEPVTEAQWSPKLCRCKGQFCKESTCEAACKRICWQRYSLNHWGCQTLNSTTSVSLNVICDGKLDCFDETDESLCATEDTFSKFEAVKTYNNLLDLLSTKSKSHEFVTSRNKFLAMHNLVRQLQKQTIRTNTDSHTIKSLRDECFMQLVSIYDDLLDTNSLEELYDHYLILLRINEKLVTALKLSHAGNENLLSPEGCYCRGGLCALRRCNKNCIQACLAEPVLTRYACNINNITVPIDSICNGRKNCPNGEDEKDCVKDVCRGHHLVVLRHNLKNIGAKYKSSVMGEVIESWRSKVSAVLFIAETSERPNHKIIVDLIGRVLHDLVMAFAAMEDYRRSHSASALKVFIGISEIVMQTLKSCAY